MRKIVMKSVVVSTIVSAAAAASLLAAGPASAASSGWHPEDTWFPDLLQCQTYGNEYAQIGGLTGYTCTPWGGGYNFRWY